jgi:hypothetical protein
MKDQHLNLDVFHHEAPLLAPDRQCMYYRYHTARTSTGLSNGLLQKKLWLISEQVARTERCYPTHVQSMQRSENLDVGDIEVTWTNQRQRKCFVHAATFRLPIAKGSVCKVFAP